MTQNIKKIKRQIKIIVDTREQNPLTFDRYSNITTISQCLKAADYTMPGFDSCTDFNSILIERKKNCWELASNLGKKWEQFQKELAIMSTYQHKFICIGAYDDFDYLHSSGKIKIHPNFIRKRLLEIQFDFKVPILFFPNREKLEDFVYYSFYKLSDNGEN